MARAAALAVLLAVPAASAEYDCGQAPLVSESESPFAEGTFQGREGLLRGAYAVPADISVVEEASSFHSPTVFSKTANKTVDAGNIALAGPYPAPWRVGTFGSASCVGLVVRLEPSASSRLLLAHFNSGSNPAASLARHESRCGVRIAAGAVAYVNGGDDSRESNALLKSALDALRARGVRDIRYMPYQSIFLDDQGRLAVLRIGKSQLADSGANVRMTPLEKKDLVEALRR